jgi:hypothetical protein
VSARTHHVRIQGVSHSVLQGNDVRLDLDEVEAQSLNSCFEWHKCRHWRSSNCIVITKHFHRLGRSASEVDTADGYGGSLKRCIPSLTTPRSTRDLYARSPTNPSYGPRGGLRKSGRIAQYTIMRTAACSADFTTSSNFRSRVSGSLSLGATAGTDSRKLRRKLLFTA